MFYSKRAPVVGCGSALALLFILVAGLAGVLYPFFYTGRAQSFTRTEVKQAQKALTDFTNGIHFTGAPDSVIRTQGKQQGSMSATIAIPASSGDYTVTNPNELSPQRIDAILRYYGSPATGEGQAIYDLGAQYGLDDAVFLADYRKESSFGNSTLASYPYYNPTGITCSDLADSCTGQVGNYNWSIWTSRERGFEAWFKLISGSYVTGKIDGGYRLTTIWLIACGPNGTGMYDGGSGCNQYAADIEHWIDTWRAGGY